MLTQTGHHSISGGPVSWGWWLSPMQTPTGGNLERASLPSPGLEIQRCVHQTALRRSSDPGRCLEKRMEGPAISTREKEQLAVASPARQAPPHCDRSRLHCSHPPGWAVGVGHTQSPESEDRFRFTFPGTSQGRSTLSGEEGELESEKE